MSTSAIHATPTSSWKQEVNRRLAEHRGRKPAAQPEARPEPDTATGASRRAQEAAARVAARYAKAPSYSELLASEARAALRAAEAASEAALKAKVAAESVLAGIEAASAPAAESGMPSRSQTSFQPADRFQEEPRAEHPRQEPMEQTSGSSDTLSIRWAQELPVHAIAPDHRPAPGENLFEDEWRKPASAEPLGPGIGEVEVVDAQPIPGNVIEFPRELVATRKVRPRLVSAPGVAEPQMQLSIFEVDPSTIATEREIEAAEPAAHPRRSEEEAGQGAGEWIAPAWCGMELDAHPEEMGQEERPEEPAALAQPVGELRPADIDRRLLAIVTDGALVAGAMVGAAFMALSRLPVLPGPGTIEIACGLGLVVSGVFYMVLFLTMGKTTPGMRYAGIRLSTFDGAQPARAQRCNRLAAMALSVLPVGLGLGWALFDEDHLCWHDRLSKTYLVNS